MQTILGQDVAAIAAGLGNDSIHVWLLDYRKTQRRDPLRALLGVYLGLPSESVVLVDGEYGRPELAPPWNRYLHFNWSHSADKAIVAVAHEVSPGVDIECIRSRPRAIEVAQRFFDPQEALALSALDEDQREAAFLRLWTGKEAVLKALGRGLAFGLHRLRLSVADVPARLLRLDEEDASLWQLCELRPDANHVATVAWRGAPRDVKMWTLAGSA